MFIKLNCFLNLTPNDSNLLNSFVGSYRKNVNPQCRLFSIGLNYSNSCVDEDSAYLNFYIKGFSNNIFHLIEEIYTDKVLGLNKLDY